MILLFLVSNPKHVMFFLKILKNTLKFNKISDTISIIQIMAKSIRIKHFFRYTDNMILTDATWTYFAQIPFRVRSALARSQSSVPFEYEDELFFKAYDALVDVNE